MERIVLFDTSVGSLNKGDEIIMSAVERQLQGVIGESFVIKGPTHCPVITDRQATIENGIMQEYENAKYKFICGTNLIWRNLNYDWPTFNINESNYRPYNNSILIGCGSGKYRHEPDEYTKEIYHKVLTTQYIHSVRDDNTKEFVESLGYRAINTGCPTLWSLTKEHCGMIPVQKAGDVVFTLTYYSKDEEKDKYLINVLLNSYQNVYFWPQGPQDFEYLQSLCEQEIFDGIRIIPPFVKAYSDFLKKNKVDYVGTRLHGGIFAMQHQKRTIIISIDNRMRYIGENNHLNTIDRNEIDQLESFINREIKTDIRVKSEDIKKWLAQF